MQKNSIIRLSKLAVPLKSKGRFFKDKRTNIRTDFQRDRDRIIHSTAFRRLKHKTQVFVNTSGDHFRTRITHSLEVAQIARTLSKFFNLNEDLCETLSLAHDLGHTPFGHAGEEILNNCMINNGGFDHNIQTLRVVTLLEKKYYDYDGLNLSIEALDGLIKHNGKITNTNKLNSILGKNFFKGKIKLKKQPSLEAQIASISDDIAYNSHDLEDGIKANLFKIEELKDIVILNDIVVKNLNNKRKKDNQIIVRQIVREIINEMVEDIILNIKHNLKKNKINKLADVYNSENLIVIFSHKMRKFDMQIKEFLREKMYYSKQVLKKTKEGKKIINFLFKQIKNNKGMFINTNDYKHYGVRSICDFIAGMTDRYAINLYKKLK